MQNYRRIFWSISIVLLLCFLLPGLVWAADSEGSGDGSGGGKLQPLAIVSSLPADGSGGVAVNSEIKLTFNKNICYMTVKEKNRNCFSLWTGSTRVPAEVILADDQMERDKRNDAVIKPLKELEAGTLYRIEVAPELESKSGVSLGKTATLTFTTAANKSAVPADVAVSSEKQGAPTAAATAANPAEEQNNAQPQGNIDTVGAAAQELSQQTAPADSISQQDYRYKRIFIDLTIVAFAGLGAWWAYRKWRG
jgi:hypothetical protein